ncbi:hypothetical protein [Streptomyces sp. NPDC014006]|uniref:hypothetical protein n=1 Tax=Streptomyces sp. NPDC014006 TaxID=3364870 RepID=UPI0036F7A699
MARQLACGMGSFVKECDCAKQIRSSHPYPIRLRDAVCKQREEAGYGTQDYAIERLTQIYAEKKKYGAIRCRGPPRSRAVDRLGIR